MISVQKCEKCNGTGKLPNPDFGYCVRPAVSAKDCDSCNPAIKEDCKSEFTECLHCEGKGMVEHVDIGNEGDMLEVLLRQGDLLTCYDCGKKLTEVRPKDDVVAEMCLDPGRDNYPRDPDEPASIYFRCADCIRERDAKKIHPRDCGCGKCSGEDRALELMEEGIVEAEKNYRE